MITSAFCSEAMNPNSTAILLVHGIDLERLRRLECAGLGYQKGALGREKCRNPQEIAWRCLLNTNLYMFRLKL